jgi:hypothetical protein
MSYLLVLGETGDEARRLIFIELEHLDQPDFAQLLDAIKRPLVRSRSRGLRVNRTEEQEHGGNHYK